MGSLSIWHWLILLIYLGLLGLFMVAAVRIAHRTGFSGWWTVLLRIPLVNIIVIWRFSKARWPAFEGRISR
jgi:hypothetical protein